MTLLRACLATALWSLALIPLALAPPALAQEKVYENSALSTAAIGYENWLKANWKPARDAKAEDLKRRGEALISGNPRQALQQFGWAVVLAEKDDAAWLGLARSILLASDNPRDATERNAMLQNTASAAFLAYQRGTSPARKAEALALVGESFRRRSQWRPAIDALKISVALAETPAVRESLNKLLAEHGFRIVDYKADVEAAPPRLCVRFSEPVGVSQADAATYIRLDGKDPQSLSVDGKQICLEGVSYGQRHQVQVRAGLPSAVEGESLTKTVDLAVAVRDRAPSVRFTGRGYVLPSRGQQGLPVVSVNTDRVKVRIYRIGDRSLIDTLDRNQLREQLSGYQFTQIKDKSGELVYRGDLTVKVDLNKEVTTAFPVSEALPELKPGVYVMSAEPPKPGKSDDEESYQDLATQWFIVSDLGLTAYSSGDGIHVFVRSLAGAGPRDGVSVRLIARNNEVLGTARTDARGYARFPAGLKRGEGGLAPAMLVADTPPTDYAFLDLTTNAFDLSDRGVAGREPPGPLDAYLYLDRGVYRPGETVHLTTLLRDNAVKAASLPVTLIVLRPDGVEHRRIVLQDQGLGGRTTALALTRSALTGTWKARIHADPKANPLAEARFLVEDYVPERLDMTLTPQVSRLVPEEEAQIEVVGRYLYGPPAANLALEGEIIVKPSSRDLPGLAGYRFGLTDEKIGAVRKPLEGLDETGEDGKATIKVELPELPKTARPLEAEVLVRLREPSGRTIERSVSLLVGAKDPRIGIRPAFTDGRVAEGEKAEFDVVLVGQDGKPMAAQGLKWELLRLEHTYQWYRRDGGWHWDSSTFARRDMTGTLDLAADRPGRVSVPTTYGRYRLVVTSANGKEAVSNIAFSSGFYASESAESPEMLDVALDKATYKAGETARVRITSRQAGKAVIAVLGSGLLMQKEVDVPAGGAVVPVEVSADWLPGAYVTATLFRPLDEASKRMPARAVGVRWLGLDTSAAELKGAMTLPERAKPASRLTVPVRITGLAPGEEARVTVAAVDIGILNLTRFESPAPQKWFHAQRRLGTEIRDLYGRLIDGMRAERGRLRSGGDGDGGMSAKGSPPVEEPLALFSGIVTPGADGVAQVSFDLPDFTGAIRLMAVAWSPSKVGSGSADLVVRDAIAVLATGPRFLTLGDKTRLEVDVHNFEGPVASYRVAVAREREGGAGQSLAQREVPLKAKERRRERFELTASEVGPATFLVEVTGPGGIAVRRRMAFDVKPPAGDIRRSTVQPLAAKGGRMTVSADLVQDMIPELTRVTVNVGPAAGLDMPGLIMALDRYPYGCAEQTVSRALPLLYLNQVAARIGVAREQEARERVGKAIERVLGMQDATGAFGAWGPSHANTWLTAYVADFLTRARELKYEVKPEAFTQALDRLQNAVNTAKDFEKGGEDIAYALYVLARNGRAPAGELRYYADARLERFATPLARAQLGAALAMTGDKERAERVFASALSMMNAADLDGFRQDYGSSLRDGAALLTLAAETRSARAETVRLADVLAKAYASRTYTSTQEQAWMLLAGQALADEARDTRLTVDGVPHQGTLIRTLVPAELKAKSLVLANAGDQAVTAVVTALGAALTPEPAAAKGFTLERAYYTLDGKRVDLASAMAGGRGEVKQNDRLVVVLKIKAEQAGGRILVVDRLPAGLEIENPRLVDSGNLKGLDWLKSPVEPEHTEFRDDRFIAAVNLFAGGERRQAGNEIVLAYMVRAVSPGTFVHPALTVEDMYKPERFARTASGTLVVTGQ